MNITRDFHPSQILLISEFQRHAAYGSKACYTVVISLAFSFPLVTNDVAKGAIYLSQILSFCVGFKLEMLKKLKIDEHYEQAHYRSAEGVSGHFAASFAPPKREVTITEYPKPAPNHAILKALYEQKIEAELVAELQSPSFNRTLVKPTNCTASKVLGAGIELQLNLALASPPIISISNGAIAIDTPRSDRQVAKFADYWKPSKKIEAAIGVDINNKLVSIDLSHPETCHILAAGTTGSGKSVWLQSLLLSLLIGRSPDEFLVAICDPKRVSFFAFKDCANLLVPIIHTPEEVIQVGNWLIAEMLRRYELFADAEVENIDQYNALPTAKKLPRILFLNDEYGDLKSACGQDKEGKKQWDEIMGINIRIGQMARASGITEAIITQKAVDVIDKKIRANLPARVLLKVLEDGDTDCVLGKVSYDGRNLLGRGDLFFDDNRLQSLFCEPSDFAKLSKGKPVYDHEELDPKKATITVKSSAIADSPQAEMILDPYAAIIAFLNGRDWQRDNHIKQSVRILKESNEPLDKIQGYLQYLEKEGFIETRSVGRGEKGLEAKKL